MFKQIKTTVALLAGSATLLMASHATAADDVIRLGNLKLAHFAAVSYIKEIAPKCGIKVEERIFAKGLDVMQAMIAGELDVGATASEAAISGRAKGIPFMWWPALPRAAPWCGCKPMARPPFCIMRFRRRWAASWRSWVAG